MNSTPIAHLDIESLRQSLSEDGFIVTPGFVEIDALKKLRNLVNLFYRGWDRYPSSTRKELNSPSTQHSAPVKEINWPRAALKMLDEEPAITQVRKLVDSLTGHRYQLIHVNSLLKPAKGGAEVAPHQDTAYNIQDLIEPLTVWIPFETVSRLNGAITYLSGSHRLGTLPHQCADKVHWIDESVLKQHENLSWQDCNGQPGTIAIHDSRVVHASHINRSDHDRLALSLRFAGIS